MTANPLCLVSEMEVAIVGGGNFGTAIANIIARNGHTTHLWMRDPQQVAQTLQARENLRYLPGHPLEPGVLPTADLRQATQSANLIFVFDIYLLRFIT